jgi:predicted SAM-dependent methyltransferase
VSSLGQPHNEPVSTAALKLHIGCGSTVVPGWENLDKSPSILLGRVPGLRPALARARLITPDQAGAVFPAGIVRADVRRGLDYPDGSAAFVYSSHMIEHMARWQGLALVRECLRVLRPGGRLRVATPDLAEWIENYRQGKTFSSDTPADAFVATFGHYVEKRGSRLGVLQRLFTGASHQWLYDTESLSHLLREAGFVDVERRAYRDSELPDIELLEDRDGSLIVEGRRP